MKRSEGGPCAYSPTKLKDYSDSGAPSRSENLNWTRSCRSAEGASGSDLPRCTANRMPGVVEDTHLPVVVAPQSGAVEDTHLLVVAAHVDVLNLGGGVLSFVANHDAAASGSSLSGKPGEPPVPQGLPGCFGRNGRGVPTGDPGDQRNGAGSRESPARHVDGCSRKQTERLRGEYHAARQIE